MFVLKRMLVEVEVDHHTVVVLARDHPGPVEAKADRLKETEHRLPTHLFVDQVTGALLETDLGLSLVLVEDQGRVQDHEIFEGS